MKLAAALILLGMLALAQASERWPASGNDGASPLAASASAKHKRHKRHGYNGGHDGGGDGGHDGDGGGDGGRPDPPSCTASQAVNVTGPANNIAVPTKCDSSDPAACPPGQWERFAVPQVTEHFTAQPSFALADARHTTYQCVDARGASPMLGTPGGDLAEIAAAAIAVLKLLGKTYDATVVDAVWRAFVDKIATPERPLYLHTDDSRLRNMFVALAPQLGAEPSILPFQAPVSAAERTAWLDALVKPEFNGCGHIRLMLDLATAPDYSVDLTATPPAACTSLDANCIAANKVAEQIIRSYFLYFWPTPEGSVQRQKTAFFVDGLLAGPLLGKAVTIISKQPAAACPHKAPLVRPNFGASQVFVYHASAVADWRAYAADVALKGFASDAGTTVEQLVTTWNAVAGLQLGATLQDLPPANNVGIFNVEVPVSAGADGTEDAN